MRARIFPPTFLDIPYQNVSLKILVIIQHTVGGIVINLVELC